ncbi:MAG TPA: hypothetical protein VMP08_16260 [Anaerolineae bacterium]|nr:hypothetical protein [Anaerolineae bacterium]
MRNQVARSEWRWVLTWIVVALIITSVPYLVGWLRSTPDRVFGGFAFAIEDGYSYLSKMKQGAEGLWLFTLPYTSESHTPTIFYLFYLLLGKFSALTGLVTPLIYHLARVFFDAILLAVIYRFIAMFTAWRSVRRIAFLLIIFSGGLGWLLILLGQTNWLNSAPIDLISPEAYTFLILYGFPHLALARTLLLLGLIIWWRKPLIQNQKSKIRNQSWLWAGLCWFGMGWLVPFYVAVIGAIVIVGLLAEAIAARKIEWRTVGRATLAGLIASPPLIYTFVIVAIDPIWKVWADQLVILSPHPLHYVLGYVLIGLLAMVGIVKTRRRHVIDPKLIGWLIAVPFLIYVPFSSQRRLIESWQIPLAFSAAIGLVYVVMPAWSRSRLVKRLTRHRRYTVHGLRNWLLAGILILSATTYALLLVEQTARIVAQIDLGFRSGAELAALRWLDERVTYNDVILSSYNTGNFLPVMVGAKAFLGHGPETAYSADKLKLVTQFYSADTSDDWRREFLRQWPITYVFFGPLEQKVGQFDPAQASYLTLMYDHDGYRIYQVNSP